MQHWGQKFKIDGKRKKSAFFRDPADRQANLRLPRTNPCLERFWDSVIMERNQRFPENKKAGL
jgi:hypothetical protein